MGLRVTMRGPQPPKAPNWEGSGTLRNRLKRELCHDGRATDRLGPAGLTLLKGAEADSLEISSARRVPKVGIFEATIDPPSTPTEAPDAKPFAVIVAPAHDLLAPKDEHKEAGEPTGA